MRQTGRRVVLGALLSLLALAAALGMPSSPGSAAPGSPGTPGSPEVVWLEDFENQPGDWQALASYTSADGVGYSASSYWTWQAGCNGMVLRSTVPPSPGTGCAYYDGSLDGLPLIARWIAAVPTGSPSSTNHALAWYSYDPTPAYPYTPGEAVLETTGIPLGTGGRYLRLELDLASTNCDGLGGSGPEFRVSLLDGGTSHDVIPLAVPCLRNDVATGGQFGSFHAARFAAGTAPLVTTASPRIRVVDEAPATVYNDGGIDNLRLLDVTPQLDAVFADTTLTTGQATTLALTVTNTSDLLAKPGWAFSDTLPTGLQVAGAPTNGCPATVSAPAGGGSIHVTGGSLATGATTCTVKVPVRAVTAGTYSHGPGNVSGTGMRAPGTSSVVYAAPPPTPSPAPSPSPPPSPPPSPTPSPTPAAGPSPSTQPTPSSAPAPAGAEAGPTLPPVVVPVAPTGPSETAEPEIVEASVPPAVADPVNPRDRGFSDPAAPSAFTDGLPSILEVVRNPGSLGLALGMGLVWTLLLLLTRGAFENALKTRYAAWTAYLARLLPASGGRLHALLAAAGALLRPDRLTTIVLLLLGNGLLVSLVDPKVGLDATTLRVICSAVLAQVVVGVGSKAVAVQVARRRYGVPARIVATPWGLGIAGVGVLLSRLIGFVPGLLSGSIVGVRATAPNLRASVHLEQVELIAGLALGIPCWVVASVVPGSGP